MRDDLYLFEELGYQVGRIRPDGVHFQSYDIEFNGFESGPNYLAVDREETDLISRIGAE